jgi:hypothetical protein
MTTGLYDVALCSQAEVDRTQGRIKGSVGPRHFSSLGPFVLSIIGANGRGGDARIILTLFFIQQPFL